TEVLLSVGGGAFVNANVKDTKKVVYNIGADILVEKTIEEAVKSIDERIDLLYNNLQKVVETTQKLEEAATQISEKVQDMMKK
ncbi:MAG: prefoldin subunit alpha, partial [Thermoplasmata archaeon]|nr:prefoldin subunit alpha [Thermoplasmata archaeon]